MTTDPGGQSRGNLAFDPWFTWQPYPSVFPLSVWASGRRPAEVPTNVVHRRGPRVAMLEERFRSVMNEEKRWSMVRGLRKTGDLLARSDLCHLHDGRAEAESCALDEKLQGQDRDVVLVARSGSNQHVWVVRRSLSEIINGRLLPKAGARADGRNGRACR